MTGGRLEGGDRSGERGRGGEGGESRDKVGRVLARIFL